MKPNLPARAMTVRPPSDSPLDRLGLALIRDPRDLVFVRVTAAILAFLAPVSALMFVPGVFRWWMTPIYLLFVLYFFIDRYILTLHATAHRPLYKKQYEALGHVAPVLLAPLFGQSPYTYFAHHIGMHHPENNLFDDLSTTMPYQRDSFRHFLMYWAKFFFLGPVLLPLYFARRGRWKLFRLFVVGELGYYAFLATMLWLAPGPSTCVFLVPFVTIRFLMMSGNWGQHAFVCPEQPENPFRNSVTLINARHNLRCFNDGYHAVHHEKQTLHWSEMPLDFEKHQDKYARNGAFVFDGIFGFQQIWMFLMRGRWDLLADRFVELGDPMTKDEIIALLKSRVAPIPRTPASTPGSVHEAA